MGWTTKSRSDLSQIGLLLAPRVDVSLGAITHRGIAMSKFFKGPKFTRYEHQYTGGGSALVWVMTILKGKHREACLCYSCERYKAGDCPIAKAIFDNCVTYNVVTPVWECPDFVEKK